MATFYFNGAVNGDWQTLGNWWMNDAFTIPATTLPTSMDDVIASATIFSNSGSEPTVANFTFNNPSSNFRYLNIAITVTGLCTFNDYSFNVGTITGDCTFNDNSYNGFTMFGTGTINGNCTFNDSSHNSNAGTINGDCTLNNYFFNYGTITGDCTFNDNATNYWISPQEWDLGTFYVGTVNGNCTFSLSSAALHIDVALAHIKTSDSITGTIDFKYEKGINGSSILGIV